jgi:hypothetical protein
MTGAARTYFFTELDTHALSELRISRMTGAARMVFLYFLKSLLLQDFTMECSSVFCIHHFFRRAQTRNKHARTAN